MGGSESHSVGLIEEAGKKGKKAGSENISSSSGSGSQTTNLIDLSMEEQDHQTRGVYQSSISTLIRKKEKEAADLAIGRFFIANNIAFNVARSPEFIIAIGATANHGPGYKPPSTSSVKGNVFLWSETTEGKVKDAKYLVDFILRDCMRSFTEGKELKRPVSTRTAFENPNSSPLSLISSTLKGAFWVIFERKFFEDKVVGSLAAGFE
ncbi:hypothetical protein QJS10_CPB13g01225 [Acorus calamus]|uniref:Uncharacterized protein n=1 Tax=Acorus calamus TaxID=4465 RepID=A0AAV9DFW9_ACOCL|nr:hypothetical protein QJS10_CPB13g01225 [Acorus calamus]